MQNVKTLGLSMLTMLSVSAVMAVSASGDTLTAQGYPAVLTGTADEGFKDTVTTTAGTVSCPEPKYDATITGPITTAGSVSVSPTFPHTGCTAFGFPATVDMNGCVYVFRVLAGTSGDVDLECSGSNELTVTATSAGILKCTVHVKAQTDLGGAVKYTNTGGGGATVEANLSGIDYTHTQGTGLGSCLGGSATSGTLTLKAIFKAETEGGAATTALFSA
ncbi:MAG TPA: hypothetical protein VFX85_08490 [Solirubrobacterales bacterium]|nr:hypothetical protein [Solirubrobacterales bacterium]